MTTRDVLLYILQRFNGVAPGCNGPWNSRVTPVRLSAHWLNLHAWAYKETTNPSYLDIVQQLADYIVSREARPYGYAFYNLIDHHSPGNGLIGQAWVMEALFTASAVLKEPRYRQVAEELFWQHRFDEQLGLWHVLNLDGTVGEIHSTLNQQVWFAAMGAQLASEEAAARVRRFLDNVDAHIHLLKGGLLGMHIRRPRSQAAIRYLLLRSWRHYVRQNLRLIRARLSGRSSTSIFSYQSMSIGYHAFTLYGFAMLRQAIADHSLWGSVQLRRAIQWGYSSAHKRAVRQNPFAMGYNPAGFEVPYVLSVFKPLEPLQIEEESLWWLNEQVHRHFNLETGQFDRSTPDAATLTSRAYEATRLPSEWLDWQLACLSKV